MPRLALVFVSLLPVLAAAGPRDRVTQNGAITISCGECGVFQSIQVVFDGQDMGANQPMRIVDVVPGEHEVKVIKWKSPFATEVLYTGLVDFPPGLELRARATRGKLDVYGRGPWSPPAPVVQEPTAEQLAAAREYLGEARESLDELQERVEDDDDACTGKVLGRLGALEDALDEAQRSTNRGWVNASLERAAGVQKVIASCGRRSSKKWSKAMDRVVARLLSANRAL